MITYPFIKWGSTNFPGWHALLPAFGTALVIYGGSISIEQHKNPTPLSILNISRFRPAQFFGDISYSLYLWHWPLIILIPLTLGTELNNNPKLKFAILVSSIIIAFISYILIENTTRYIGQKNTYPFRTAVLTCLCGALLLFSIIVSAHFQETRATDYSKNIIAKAFKRAEDPLDISFVAKATMNKKEFNYNPYGKVDKKLA